MRSIRRRHERQERMERERAERERVELEQAAERAERERAERNREQAEAAQQQEPEPEPEEPVVNLSDEEEEVPQQQSVLAEEYGMDAITPSDEERIMREVEEVMRERELEEELDDDQAEAETVLDFDEVADNDDMRRQLDWVVDTVTAALGEPLNQSSSSEEMAVTAAARDLEFSSRVDHSVSKVRFTMDMQWRRLERELNRSRRILNALNRVRDAKSELARNRGELDRCTSELRRLARERRRLCERRGEVCANTARALAELRELRESIPNNNGRASNAASTSTAARQPTLRRPTVVLDRLRPEVLANLTTPRVTTRSIGTDPDKTAMDECAPAGSRTPAPAAVQLDPLAELATRLSFCNICTVELPMSAFLLNFDCSHIHCRDCVRHHYEATNDISWTRRLRLRELQCMTCRSPISQYFMLQRTGELYSYKRINYNLDLLDNPPPARS